MAHIHVIDIFIIEANIMTADVLTRLGIAVSTAIVLTCFSPNIMVLASEGFTHGGKDQRVKSLDLSVSKSFP